MANRRPNMTVNDFKIDFDEQTRTSRYMTWGIWVTRPFRQMIHAPNGMQLTRLNETPKMKCNKRDFDLWRRDEETASNIGSNGDGSSLEVPRNTDFWESRQCLHPLGYGWSNNCKPKTNHTIPKKYTYCNLYINQYWKLKCCLWQLIYLQISTIFLQNQ